MFSHSQAPVRGHLRQVRPDECPFEVQLLLEDCINADVAARPTAEQLLGRLQAVMYPPNGGASTQALAAIDDVADIQVRFVELLEGLSGVDKR